MMGVLRHDLRYALRSVRQRPGFTALTVTTLALGIGATSAIFSVLSGVLLRPLPYDRPDDVMMIHTRLEGNPRGELSLPEYRDLQEQAKSFTRVAAFSDGSLTLTGTGTPERLEAGFVTADALPLLGVSPARGRGFAAEEDLLVVSQGAWLAGLGIGAGLIGALAATRLLAGLLFGIGPADPATLVATAASLALVAVLASLVPALRAIRTDPVDALRAE
jgi:putative ABC transport system permease protein